MQRDPHLASRREDVDRAVGVEAEVGPVRSGGLGELLDLVAQERELLLGLLEGEGQLLVLRDGLLQLAAGLEETLFERLDARVLVLSAPGRCVVSPA